MFLRWQRLFFGKEVLFSKSSFGHVNLTDFSDSVVEIQMFKFYKTLQLYGKQGKRSRDISAFEKIYL